MTEGRGRDEADDHDLVDAAKGGDRGALDALLRRHAERIHAVCRRMMANDADAADAMQDAMIAIVRGLHRFDGRSRFGTWAYRVTTNACLDELRRRQRRPHPVDDDDSEPLLPAPGDVATETSTRLDVDAALARLPTDFRAAVVLRDLCGLDYAEIAEVLGVPVGTVRSRISRGRSALVPLLEGNRATPGDRPTARP